MDRRCENPENPRAAIIVCHGFKGFKRWGFFPYLSQRLADAGHDVYTLDFSRNGIGEDPEEFTRLDLFAGNTYSQELSDLQTLLSWVRAQPGGSGIPVGLLGHSRGAVPVMVAAREDDGIEAIVTWSGVGRLLRVSDGQLDRWRKQGEMEFTNARTGQRMAMSYRFVEDVREHADRLDLAAAAREMRAAHLIVHGEADLAVPVEEAELLRAGRERGCRLEIVAGASHTFGVKHPFEGAGPHLQAALAPTLDWFGEHLAVERGRPAGGS